MKKILYSKEAREKLYKGVEKILKAVSVTLGPSGRNVLIRNNMEGKPFSTKDGVTVANQVWSEDPVEMIAIESFQDVANSSDEMSGDGTTTATILAASIFKMGLDASIDDNTNLLLIKRGIDIAVNQIKKDLLERSIDIKEDEKKLKEVALIASNDDDEIAGIVYKAFDVAGKQGVVNIKRSSIYKTYLSTIKGMTLPMGYRSKYYITNHENETCVLDEPYVFMTNKKITKITPNFDYLLNTIAEEQGSLLIIAPDVDINISDMLIRNKINANFKVCVCRPPGFGDEQKENLKDIGSVLGKEPFIENEGLDFDLIPSIEIFDLIPKSTEVIIGEHNTTIKEALVLTEEESKKIEYKKEARANYLREELKKHKTSYEKNMLQTRISRLTEGIAYINIWAISDSEYIEKQGRVQDALYSIKAAYDEGVIPGGGTALYTLSKERIAIDNKDIQKGIDIVYDAIKFPFFQIIKNVGYSKESFTSKFSDCIDVFNIGFNAKNEKVEDLITAGVVDPVKVTRIALENAASIAGLLLTTECLIVDEDVYKKNN